MRERKEAEASKDAPETPQDSGAEQKHHTLFGKQFTEKEQKTLFLYLVIGIVPMELAGNGGRYHHQHHQRPASSSGVPHFHSRGSAIWSPWLWSLCSPCCWSTS